jgi:co-chaperonin GroES (HSP10)
VTFRAYADNVVIELLPLETQTASGLTIVHGSGKKSREHRRARVIASGPGYYQPVKGDCGEVSARGAFVPNETKPGDIVLVDALAGQDYAMDHTVPRHNKSAEFQELFGDRGQFRIVREQEILAILESDAEAAE